MLLVPRISSAEAKAKHKDIDAWRNFAQRITHHLGVSRYLQAREAGLCSFCKQQLHETVHIHHIDYDHSCSFGVTKTIRTPTAKRPNRVRPIPDCKACSVQRRDLFDGCMAKLTVVHAGCNARIFQLRPDER